MSDTPFHVAQTGTINGDVITLLGALPDALLFAGRATDGGKLVVTFRVKGADPAKLGAWKAIYDETSGTLTRESDLGSTNNFEVNDQIEVFVSFNPLDFLRKNSDGSADFSALLRVLIGGFEFDSSEDEYPGWLKQVMTAKGAAGGYMLDVRDIQGRLRTQFAAYTPDTDDVVAGVAVKDRSGEIQSALELYDKNSPYGAALYALHQDGQTPIYFTLERSGSIRALNASDFKIGGGDTPVAGYKLLDEDGDTRGYFGGYLPNTEGFAVASLIAFDKSGAQKAEVQVAGSAEPHGVMLTCRNVDNSADLKAKFNRDRSIDVSDFSKLALRGLSLDSTESLFTGYSILKTNALDANGGFAIYAHDSADGYANTIVMHSPIGLGKTTYFGTLAASGAFSGLVSTHDESQDYGVSFITRNADDTGNLEALLMRDGTFDLSDWFRVRLGNEEITAAKIAVWDGYSSGLDAKENMGVAAALLDNHNATREHLPDAPVDGNQYVRKNGEWVTPIVSSGIGSSLSESIEGLLVSSPAGDTLECSAGSCSINGVAVVADNPVQSLTVDSVDLATLSDTLILVYLVDEGGTPRMHLENYTGVGRGGAAVWNHELKQFSHPDASTLLGTTTNEAYRLIDYVRVNEAGTIFAANSVESRPGHVVKQGWWNVGITDGNETSWTEYPVDHLFPQNTVAIKFLHLLESWGNSAVRAEIKANSAGGPWVSYNYNALAIAYRDCPKIQHVTLPMGTHSFFSRTAANAHVNKNQFYIVEVEFIR